MRTFSRKGLRTFSWRLSEKFSACSVLRNVRGRWSCISPRRWQRPRWWIIWNIRPGSVWNVGWRRIPGMPAVWPNPSSRWRHGGRRLNWFGVACDRSRPPNSSARASARCITGAGRTGRAAWPRCSFGTGTTVRPTSPRRDGAPETTMTWGRCTAGSRSWSRGFVPEKLRRCGSAHPWRGDQFVSMSLSLSRDMSR